MSKSLKKSEKDRFAILLMGAVDNELTEQEQFEFDQLVLKYPVPASTLTSSNFLGATIIPPSETSTSSSLSSKSVPFNKSA